jgi:hypothetical protein
MPSGGEVIFSIVPEQCSWCGVAVVDEDGFRAAEPAGERTAAFCRLEHIVPWAIQGARWEAGTLSGLDPEDDAAAGLGRCAQCARPLDETYVLLVRHRGVHRIADAFCNPDHMLAWAKAGGRWRGAA